MKRLVSTTLATGVLLLGSAGAASAHSLPPCNDADMDGEFSGREYAAHHIVALAHDGVIGQQHKPGSHHGFSLCNPSGK